MTSCHNMVAAIQSFKHMKMPVQAMAELEEQLIQLQNEERETKELELKSAQQRRQALEDLEKTVSNSVF